MEHITYGPGELLKKATGLYRKRSDVRYDILIDVGWLLRTESVRTKDLLRIMYVDHQTYLVEEKRGKDYHIVFRATFRKSWDTSPTGHGLEFHEREEGGWVNALARWSESERTISQG